MLNSFRSHLSILSKKWYGITTKYRACSGCSAQTNRMKDSTLKDASRSSEYSDAVPVLDEDLNPDSRKDGKQSNKNNLNFYRYKSLIEDHEVSRLDLWTLLKFIKNARHLGHMVPKQISTEDMLNLYIQPSITKRLRLMKYLREREIKLLKKLHPKSSPVYENPLPRPEYTAHVLPQYGLHRNSIMVRIRDLNMSLFYEQRLVANLPFAPKVVLDFAYNDLMSEREATKAYLDILELYSYNRQSEQPFNMIFCGIPDCHESKARTQSNGLPNKIYDYLIGNRSVPFPLEYTSRTVTDIFPRDKLIYLSPDAEDVLETIDEDNIYVLGVLVDKEFQPGLSAQRARDLGVRSARFPARIRLYWEEEEKPLHIVHCLRILNEVWRGKNWFEAISGVDSKLSVEVENADQDDGDKLK